MARGTGGEAVFVFFVAQDDQGRGGIYLCDVQRNLFQRCPDPETVENKKYVFDQCHIPWIDWSEVDPREPVASTNGFGVEVPWDPTR